MSDLRVQKAKIVFVLSSGRSGSQTISASLDEYRNITSLHHPKPEFIGEAIEVFYGRRDPAPVVEEYFRTRAEHLSGRRWYAEANLQLTFLLRPLLEVAPQARVIWLQRDGRDAVASMYHRGWYDPEKGGIWNETRLRGDLCGDYTEAEWEALDRFRKCCWVWKKYNQVIETATAELPAWQWRSVRLDRLKSSMPILRKWLGLRGWGGGVEKLNVALQPVHYWEAWSPERRRSFEEECAPEMDRWFPEWRDGSGEWKLISPPPPDRPRVSKRLRVWARSQYRNTVRRATRFARRIAS